MRQQLPDDGEGEERLNSEWDVQPVGDGTCQGPQSLAVAFPTYCWKSLKTEASLYQWYARTGDGKQQSRKNISLKLTFHNTAAHSIPRTLQVKPAWWTEKQSRGPHLADHGDCTEEPSVLWHYRTEETAQTAQTEINQSLSSMEMMLARTWGGMTPPHMTRMSGLPRALSSLMSSGTRVLCPAASVLTPTQCTSASTACWATSRGVCEHTGRGTGHSPGLGAGHTFQGAGTHRECSGCGSVLPGRGARCPRQSRCLRIRWRWLWLLCRGHPDPSWPPRSEACGPHGPWTCSLWLKAHILSV